MSEIFVGGGEIGALMRAMDWTRSPLGPVAQWPQSLRTAVSILLGSPDGLQLFWGPELVLLYNDATRPMMGGKHPACFAQPALAQWPEVSDYLGPMLRSVLSTGTAVSTSRAMIPTRRNGFLEEQYFSWSYSPVRVESGAIGGVFQVASMTTEEVLGERRQDVLEGLAGLSRLASSAEDVCVVAASQLLPADIPFALIYLLDDHTGVARLAAAAGLELGTSQSPIAITISGDAVWPLAEVATTHAPRLVEDLEARFGAQQARGWAEPPHRALVLPLSGPHEVSPCGFLIAGLSAGLGFDHSYAGFLNLVAGQIGAGVAQVRASEIAATTARLEVELKQANARARTELEALAEQLRLADRRKDEFLAMLGHELRNPLAPIATAVAIMKLRGGEDGARERDVIERQVEHLSRLVDDLFDVSRIAGGKVALDRHVVDLSAIIDRALEMTSPLFESRRQHLSVEVAREGLAVDGDTGRLTQVISNLLTNASKFTPESGHIWLSARREAAEVVLRVRDGGIGIEASLLPVMFDLFVQGPQGLQRKESGLGLGLSLVKNLVALHGGSVSAHSEGSGQGAELVVRLPVATRPAAVRAPVVTRRGAQKHVLVVDDNQDAADMLADLLRRHGHDVVVAYDGAQALSLLKEFPVEVGVLDIGLPIMDGYELARSIRELPIGRTFKLIALTGYGQDSHGARASDAGFDGFFSKPIVFADLLSEIDRAAP